jgi:hypothetical protein
MVFLLLPFSQELAWATDLVSPEEDLLTLYSAGRVDEARGGFRKLVDDRLAWAEETLAKPLDSEFHATEMAWKIAALSETLAIWEAAEILLQHRGDVTPPQVYTEVGERITRADQLMERLEAQREKEIWSKRENEVGFENARKSLQKSFTKTIAFLRNGASAEKRQELLLRAARRGGMPSTLEDFDAKNADLLKLFNIILEP